MYPHLSFRKRIIVFLFAFVSVRHYCAKGKDIFSSSSAMFGFTFKRASTVNPIVSAPPPPNRRPSLSPSSSSPLHLPDIIVSSSSSSSPSARATGGRSRGNLSRVSVSHFDLPSLFKGGGENRSRRYVVEEGGEREGEKVGIGGGVGWIEKFQRRVLGGKMSLALGKRGRGIVQRILPTQFSTESEAGNEEGE